MLIEKINNQDPVKINLFGKEKEVVVFSTGDSQFDENGDYREDNFPLNAKEIEILNWLINGIDLSAYKKEIAEYCNVCYEMYCDKTISENDVEAEVNITAIAINISEVSQSNDGFKYPEISFLGECLSDEEDGICIGFRDKKFLGIQSQDWTL